jgi:hypothetical protein
MQETGIRNEEHEWATNMDIIIFYDLILKFEI